MAASTREYFEQRFGALDPSRITSRRLSAIGKQALDHRDGAAAIAAKAANHPHLNDVGKRAARQKALEEAFILNEQAQMDLEDMKSNADAAIRELALPPLDKGDIVGEMREAEARAIVRGMPREQRDRIERLPAALAAAVVRAPAELSGVSQSVHAMLRDGLIETAHPAKLAGIRNDIAGVDLASHVLKEAAIALRNAAEFAPGEDREYLQRIKAQAARPKARTDDVDPNDLDAIIASHRRKNGPSAA